MGFKEDLERVRKEASISEAQKLQEINKGRREKEGERRHIDEGFVLKDEYKNLYLANIVYPTACAFLSSLDNEHWQISDRFAERVRYKAYRTHWDGDWFGESWSTELVDHDQLLDGLVLYSEGQEIEKSLFGSKIVSNQIFLGYLDEFEYYDPLTMLYHPYNKANQTFELTMIAGTTEPKSKNETNSINIGVLRNPAGLKRIEITQSGYDNVNFKRGKNKERLIASVNELKDPNSQIVLTSQQKFQDSFIDFIVATEQVNRGFLK